jgi:hypothetical protein
VYDKNQEFVAGYRSFFIDGLVEFDRGELPVEANRVMGDEGISNQRSRDIYSFRER